MFYYNILNTPVEFLKSKRIGMKRDEFIDMYQYSDTYRRRQLSYDSSHALRKKYMITTEDFSDELEMAFEDEFGYTYSSFVKVVATMILMNEEEVICTSQKDLVPQLINLNCELDGNIVEKVIGDITYCPREDYLKLPKGFDKEDAYPWRFNRRYSFNRRPVLKRGEDLLWGNRQLYHMSEYIIELIYSGKFKAKSDTMKVLCGKIVKRKGADFNELIYQMICDMNAFEVHSNVKKINGKRIAENGCDLGDIDILIIDKVSSKVIAAEVKNFHFSRNPREINIEYEKMFVDTDSKPCFLTKHSKRTQWVT